MILTEKIIAYLRDLFLAVGFGKEETNEQILSLEKSFRILLISRILQKIPQDKQKQASLAMEKVKNQEEFFSFLTKFFKKNLKEKEIKKIYQEEMEKILEPILKPLKESCTPEQLIKLQALTAKYF